MKPKYRAGDVLKYELGVVKHDFIYEDYVAVCIVERDKNLYLADEGYYTFEIDTLEYLDRFCNGDLVLRHKIKKILFDKFWTVKEALVKYEAGVLLFYNGKKRIKLELLASKENGKYVHKFLIDYIESDV